MEDMGSGQRALEVAAVEDRIYEEVQEDIRGVSPKVEGVSMYR